MAQQVKPPSSDGRPLSRARKTEPERSAEPTAVRLISYQPKNEITQTRYTGSGAEGLSRAPTWNVPKTQLKPNMLPANRRTTQNFTSANEPYLRGNEFPSEWANFEPPRQSPTIDYNPAVRAK